MALPATITTTTPAGSDALSQGDDQIRALKLAICDILGIPNATAINNVLLEVVAAGLKSIYMSDAAANPTVSGQLRRNATDLLYHNGTVARSLLGAGIVGMGQAAGSGAGAYTTTSATFVDVDAVNLNAAVVVPANARNLLVGFSGSLLCAGAVQPSEGKVQMVIGATALSTVGAFFTATTYAYFSAFTALNVIPTGAANIRMQYRRGTTGTSVTIFNSFPESAEQLLPRFWYILTN